MKEILKWIWNLPAEYIAIPALLFAACVSFGAIFIIYKAGKQIFFSDIEGPDRF